MTKKTNQPVSLFLVAPERNYPGYRFTGTVARSAGTLDPVTRTLRTELDFKNDDPEHRIFPGSFGEVIIGIQREQPVLTVPTSALLFESDGKQVAVVTPENKIHFQKITPGRDFGTEIEIASGLKGDEKVVANPGEQLAEGVDVTAEAPKADGKQPGNDGKQGKEGRRRQGFPLMAKLHIGNGRSAAAVLCLAAAGILAGCVVDQSREVRTYRKVLDGQEPKPKPLEPGETLTLGRALALANADNEQIASQGEAYLQALIEKNRTFAAFLPTVSFQPNFTVEEAPGETPRRPPPARRPWSAASAAASAGATCRTAACCAGWRRRSSAP